VPFIDAPLDVRKVGDRTWQLLARVIYNGDYGRWSVPYGYVTDFASVPRLLWILFPQSGRWDQAAVVHDYLITDVLPTGKITSAHVDAEFRGALKVLNVGLVKRWLMWAGVRWAAPFTKSRRSWGWFKTLPALLGVSAAALAPVVVPLVLLLKG
jgi:hypothetical protein